MTTVLPVYYQIKQVIKGWIVDKQFGPGEKIPSENELAERFKVSRLTVRQAIGQLSQEGFLLTKRGEGTFVTRDERLINSYSSELIGFMEDLFYQVTRARAKFVEVRQIEAPKPIREKLELEDPADVVQIKRVRFLEEKPLTFSVNHLPLEIGTKIREGDLYKKPLLQVLEQDLGIRFSEALQTIEASFASSEVSERLMIPSGSPILFVERVMYDEKHRPIEIFQSSYRGDLYKFIVRFKKVKGKKGSTWVQHGD
jgi:GntR family transcriptional regulator